MLCVCLCVPRHASKTCFQCCQLNLKYATIHLICLDPFSVLPTQFKVCNYQFDLFKSVFSVTNSNIYHEMKQLICLDPFSVLPTQNGLLKLVPSQWSSQKGSLKNWSSHKCWINWFKTICFIMGFYLNLCIWCNKKNKTFWPLFIFFGRISPLSINFRSILFQKWMCDSKWSLVWLRMVLITMCDSKWSFFQ